MVSKPEDRLGPECTVFFSQWNILFITSLSKWS